MRRNDVGSDTPLSGPGVLLLPEVLSDHALRVCQTQVVPGGGDGSRLGSAIEEQQGQIAAGELLRPDLQIAFLVNAVSPLLELVWSTAITSRLSRIDATSGFMASTSLPAISAKPSCPKV